MILKTYRDKVKEDIKHKYIKLYKKSITNTDLGFLFIQLWLIAKGDSSVIPSPELEENLIPLEATDKEIEVISENYIQRLKQDYSSEIELIKELIYNQQN